MLSSIVVYIFSAVIFILVLIFFFIKKKTSACIFRFTFLWVIITISIAVLFFPLYYQGNAVLQGSYSSKIQSFAFFTELTKIITWTNSENLFGFLKSYIISSVIPVICVGIILGLLIRMNFNKWKSFFAVSVLICIGIVFLKLLVCFTFQSWYLTVTPEDAIYLFVGCMIGSFLLFVIRKILININFENGVMNGFQTILFQKANKRPIRKGYEEL